jgi:hypothetical protein
MIKRAVILAALFSSTLALAEPLQIEHRERSNINSGFRVNYALRTTPEFGTMHGFGLGLKGYFQEKGYLETHDTVKRINDSYSLEFSVNSIFGDKINLYEFGVTGATGIYTSKAQGALELIFGLARMGITSRGGLLWSPSIGLELKLGPLTITPALEGYLGNCTGFGFGLNTGVYF